ncbi:MAG: heavy-metal-associated domain-containing protein [Tissierellia bacterium]|nr:heavy-metal-associated domain-containing protein [Tissierellia bacterium]
MRLNSFKAIETSSIEESDKVAVEVKRESINVDYSPKLNLPSKIMKISGMTCSHCSNRVEKALNSIEGVKATLNLEENQAIVELSKEISDEVLINAVEEAGYIVEEIV